jgi:hypothetical protein
LELADVDYANDCCCACAEGMLSAILFRGIGRRQLRAVDGETSKETHKNPSERIKMTESFVLGFIFIFHTKNTGKIPKDQSVTALIAACA